MIVGGYACPLAIVNKHVGDNREVIKALIEGTYRIFYSYPYHISIQLVTI